ncbi:MAG: metallophosphoesterase [Anaerolineales bacterium]|nr:metallophosphoesterase [Anaerolineales bacterium]
MKIAITADNHLTSQDRNSERFTAMEDILHRCVEFEVDILVIAGDLFDHANPNYAEFETLYSEHAPPDLNTFIIPGNHDHNLTGKGFILDDVTVFTKPKVLSLENAEIQILFLPFREGATMGEEIAPFSEELVPHRWVLISHGDWIKGEKYADPYEPGTYMPLSKIDLDSYKPFQVFLGHIHRPSNYERVHYPGSPCPLDITETGLRRFLIFDTQNGKITSHPVNSPILYEEETFLALPLENELAYLESQIKERIHSWSIPEGWEDNVYVRVNVIGYTQNRADILGSVNLHFAPYHFYNQEGPDLSKLNYVDDPDRAHLTRQVKNWVEELNWKTGSLYPGKDQILIEALKVVYGA